MVKEAITWAIIGIEVNTNEIFWLFFPEKFMLGVISGVPPLPPPGNSHFSDSILRGDKSLYGPPGSLMEKNEKTLWKLLIIFINKLIR